MSAAPAPAEETAAYGLMRSDLIDAMLLGRDVDLPTAVETGLRAWADDVIAAAHGPLLGLSTDGIADDVYAGLRWAGMPMSTQGDLLWDTDVQLGEEEKPFVNDDRLIIPGPTQLKVLTSVAMRPLRRFVADRYQIRLQAATGISCYLWRNQALFISCLDVRVSGFVHGPDHGQRSSLALGPGEAQLSSWHGNE